MQRVNKIWGIMSVAGLAAAGAVAQPDNAQWNGFKGGGDLRGSASVSGNDPAVNIAWDTDLTVDDGNGNPIGPVSVGGLAIGEDGSVYFKSRRNASTQRVYKVDPATGAVVEMSEELPGDGGAYNGVYLANGSLWTAVSIGDNGNGVRESRIYKLNPTTLATETYFSDMAVFDDADSAGLRGAPIFATVTNNAGNYNMYLHERGAGVVPQGEIHAVDSATGDIEWSYSPTFIGGGTFFGVFGPVFEAGGNMQIGYFGNEPAGFAGRLVQDNGDGTWTEQWLGGPDNFNWYGSGALSEDGQNIYVTTFNDGDTPSLWALDADTGAINWAVPGNRGTIMEHNFFARPSVAGNRVYACGGFGTITCFEPNANNDNYTQPWVIRAEMVEDPNNPGFPLGPLTEPAGFVTTDDFYNSGEITAYTVAKTAGGRTFIYATMQQQPQDPNGNDPLVGQFIVVEDLGSSANVILRTTFNDTLSATAYGNAGIAIAENGDVYMGGGSISFGGRDAYQLYKMSADAGNDCPADLSPPPDGDGAVNTNDFFQFLTYYQAQDPAADFSPAGGDGNINTNDFFAFLAAYQVGCQ